MFNMEAVRNCFGGKRRHHHALLKDADEGDRDPLLPRHINGDDHSSIKPIPTTKLKDGRTRRRFVDLEIPANIPSPREPEGLATHPRGSMNDKPGLDRLVDAFAALSAGKLPTQDQITRILQVLLNSELLSGSPLSETLNSSTLDGNGPMGRRGRKVIQDVRGVVQAIAQFGMEKNNDNKLQSLVAKLGPVLSAQPSSNLPNGSNLPRVKVDVNLQQAAGSSKAAFDAGSQAASEIRDQIPPSREIGDDVAILVHAIRTLVTTLITSPVFRALLKDLLSVIRDIVAQGASDVRDAAGQVESVASGVERDLKRVDVENKVDASITYAHVVAAGGEEEHGKPLDDAQKVARDTVAEISDAVEGAKQLSREKAAGWRYSSEQAKQKVKEDTGQRLQQVRSMCDKNGHSSHIAETSQLLARAGEDPASRSALRAILILIRKYADKIEDISEKFLKLTEEVSRDVQEGVMGSVGVDVDVEGMNLGQDDIGSYPPPKTMYPPKASDTPHNKETSPARTPLEDAMLDLKTLLERIAKAHSLDAFLTAFGKVVKDLNELPIDAAHKVKDGIAESSSARTIKPRRPESPHNQEKGKGPIINDAQDPTPQPNVISAYCSRLGLYIDHALDDTKWVTSRPGQDELDNLLEHGAALLDVVGKVVVNGVEDAADAVQQIDEGKNQSVLADDLRRRFRDDARSLFQEVDAYVGAVEQDRTTMKLVQSFKSLGESLAVLMGLGGMITGKTSSLGAAKHALWSSLEWTEWMTWVVPKLLKIMPIGAFPIPSMEAKSETGGWEAGLYALFVRGNAEAKQREVLGEPRGRHASQGRRPRGGVETTLIPDSVVVREWTEVRVDMAEANERERAVNSTGSRHRSTASSMPSSSNTERTSRIRMEINGIRAKVDGLGYYFKYGGPWIGYEDEGIVDVDVGVTAGPYEGFGCEVELEMGAASHLQPAVNDSTPTQSQTDEGDIESLDLGGGPNVLLGEGVEGEGEISLVAEPVPVVPEEVEELSSGGGGPNSDIQRALNPTEPIGSAVTRAQGLKSGVPVSSLAKDVAFDPLFKVADINVHMRGVKVRLEKSRHWILNKVLVQPLAGRAIGEAVRALVQQEVKERLEGFALGLGRIKFDVDQRRRARREEAGRMRALERRERRRRMILNPTEADDQRLGELDKADEDTEDESWLTFLEDWCLTLVKSGSGIFADDRDKYRDDVNVKSNVDVTAKGVVYFQEAYSPRQSTYPSPQPMVFNKRTGEMEALGNQEDNVGDEELQSDLTLAVGGGPQLFGDKAIPYGARMDEEEDVVEEGRKFIGEVRETANRIGAEALGTVAHAGSRFNARRTQEDREGWYSDAFDV